MKKPKVSLIIPVYKGANYMKEAIDSALDQTYDNLEIIVVNDGSPDGGATERIAKSYGNKIRYFAKENGGVSTALNMAIKNMKGEYFTWLSHDDLYLPNKVEEQIDYLIKHDLVGTKTILYADYALINEHSYLLSEQHKNHYLLNEYVELSLLSGAINGLTLMIPKRAFDECGLFDESLRCVQDYKLWFDFLKAGYNFIHQNKVFTATRLHLQQTTNVSPVMVSEGEDFWKEVLDYYESKVSNKIYGSKYMYYNEMHNFFRYTPYNGLTKYTQDVLDKFEKKNEKNKELVSVIISYKDNLDNVIKSAKSVLNQNYKNIEIILVDNNSKEKSKKLDETIKKNKIIYIQRKDSNKILGLNEAIKKSTGEYIAFLEPGNEFSEEKINVQLQKLKTSEIGFSHTSYDYENNGKKDYINSGTQSGLIRYNVISENRINFSTVMVKSDYIKNNNIYFDDTREYGGYDCFYLDLLSKTNALGIDLPLVIVHDDAVNYTYSNDYQIRKSEEILTYVLSDKTLCDKQNNIKALINYINTLYNSQDGINYNRDFDYTKYRPKIKNWRNWRILKPVKRVRNKIRRTLARK